MEIDKKEDKLKEKNQDSISAEKGHEFTNQKDNNIISIKDVVDKHATSKNTHELPQDEQQHDAFLGSKDKNQ